MVRQHLATFVAQVEEGDQAGRLPAFVKRELVEAYLACGLLTHGCVHVRCEHCGDDIVVAFSCKGRGFCPSCGGRRMTELAAHLVDRLIPDVPVRQLVLSLPWRVRVLAPHAAWRALMPRSQEGAGHEASALVASAPALPLKGSSPPAPEPARLSWATLLTRVFAFDVFHCPRCGGRRRIVAVHTRPETLRPLLERLGLDLPPAATRASRSPPAAD